MQMNILRMKCRKLYNKEIKTLITKGMFDDKWLKNENAPNKVCCFLLPVCRMNSLNTSTFTFAHFCLLKGTLDDCNDCSELPINNSCTSGYHNMYKMWLLQSPAKGTSDTKYVIYRLPLQLLFLNLWIKFHGLNILI